MNGPAKIILTSVAMLYAAQAEATEYADPLPRYERAGAGFGCVMTKSDHERLKAHSDVLPDMPCERIGPLFTEMSRVELEKNLGAPITSPDIPAGAPYKVYGLKSSDNGALVTYAVVTYTRDDIADAIQVTGEPWPANWKFSGIGLGDTREFLLARFGKPMQKRASDDPGAEVWSYLPWIFSFEVKNGVVSSIKVAVEHQPVTKSGAQ